MKTTLLYIAVASIALLLADRASAQSLFEFRGTVVSTTSAVYQVGDTIDLRLGLASNTPIFSFTPSYATSGTCNEFQMSSFAVTVNGTDIPLAIASVITDYQLVESGYTYNGIAFGSAGTVQAGANPAYVDLDFLSGDVNDVNQYGLPLGGLPLAHFSGSMQLSDTTWTGGSSGYAWVQITDYSVIAVPEPSVYGVVAGVAGLIVAIGSRRRGRQLRR